jgi:DNA-binding MarR family transcriptional regulator
MNDELSPGVTDPSLEADIRHLAVMLAPVWRALKPQVDDDAMKRKAMAAGLGPRHFPVLFHAALEGPLSVTELAGHVGLSLSMTSLLVGELSRSGFLERREDEQDRRRTLVSVPEGHRVAIKAWMEAALEPMRRALGRLSSDERAAFMKGWRLLEEESGAAPGSDACSG